MCRRERSYIDGEWCGSAESLSVSDLTEGKTFAEITASSPNDVRLALKTAHETTSELRQTTVVRRAKWCEEIAAGIRKRGDELAEIIVREAGKPISSAHSEVDSAAMRFDRAAEEARNIVNKGEFREGSTVGHEGWNAIVAHEPIGLVLCVTPYNYPLATSALQIAPALAAGNCVIHKPASRTPISGAILADVIAGVDDIPDGAFNFTPGHSKNIGDILASDHRVDGITMTGSSSAGEHIARESRMVTLHMELGGNAPAIVFDDADLENVASACAKGALAYAGQRCSAISRVIVQEDVHDTVVDQIEDAMSSWRRGDLFDETTDLGPLISEQQATWVEKLVDDALERGGTLVCGGSRSPPKGTPDELERQFYEPTLLSDVPRDARIVDEEQFGPVAVVTTFTDQDDVTEMVNDSDLALDAAVFTTDYDRALDVADRLEVGAVRINGAPSHGLGDIPFGGNNRSGIGREGLDASIHELMRTKSIIL